MIKSLLFNWVCLIIKPVNKAKKLKEAKETRTKFVNRPYNFAIWFYSLFLRACFVYHLYATK